MMKSEIRIVWVLVAVLAIAPGALLARPKVSVDYDRKADFSRIRTYAWKEGTPADNRLMEQRIHKAVDNQLKAKGLKQVDAEPDIYVVTHVSTSNNTRVDVQSFGYGGWYGWDGWVMWGPATSAQLRDVLTGMLIVDILCGETKLLIWRGVASGTLGQMPDPDRVAKKVLTVTDRMFREFPPRGESR